MHHCNPMQSMILQHMISFHYRDAHASPYGRIIAVISCRRCLQLVIRNICFLVGSHGNVTHTHTRCCAPPVQHCLTGCESCVPMQLSSYMHTDWRAEVEKEEATESVDLAGTRYSSLKTYEEKTTLLPPTYGRGGLACYIIKGGRCSFRVWSGSALSKPSCCTCERESVCFEGMSD